jgi:hypothetical protein
MRPPVWQPARDELTASNVSVITNTRNADLRLTGTSSLTAPTSMKRTSIASSDSRFNAGTRIGLRLSAQAKRHAVGGLRGVGDEIR